MVAVIAAVLVPWKQLAERGMVYALEQNGYPGARLAVESLSLERLHLREVSLGDAVAVTFDTLVFTYTWERLWNSNATLLEAKGRWGGGRFSVRDAAVAWEGAERFRGEIRVESVPLSPLLKLATGGRADATGSVSGTLPVTVYADGSASLRTATLKANKPGVFHISPDLLSGESGQIMQVRTALSDFRYSELSLTAESDKNKKLSMLVKLYGNNPKAYNGREVKLNVRVQGDLLSVLQQSVPVFSDPKRFLEEKK